MANLRRFSWRTTRLRERRVRTLDVVPLYQGVGNGELDAFQDVWLPAHEGYIQRDRGEAELLTPGFRDDQIRFWGPRLYEHREHRPVHETTRDLSSESNRVRPACRKFPRTSSSRKPRAASWASTPGMPPRSRPLQQPGGPSVFIAWSPHWRTRGTILPTSTIRMTRSRK